MITTETEEYLKKPTFDSWHWEASEMVSLMEHMYHSLGLIAATHMNPETLRKWLVRREGVREGGREGTREGTREGGREGGNEGGREGGREGWREGGRDGARKGAREE